MTVRLSGASRGSFVVGGNAPWLNCGWDFGPSPVGFGDVSRDFGALVHELRALRCAGLSVLRWWILAGGINYPVGEEVARLARPRRSRGGMHWWWRSGQLPVALGDAFLGDFAALCAACRAAGIGLWPSLLSFEWFLPSDRFSRGRAPLIFGHGGRALAANVSRFLDATLSPLLHVSERYRDVIHAFEPVNEPDWVTRGGPLLGPALGKGRVPGDHMRALLSAAVARIAASGFVSSIGFKQLHPRWIEGELRGELQRLSTEGRYLHQVHHYPHILGEGRLAPASASPFPAVYVGEFPTGMGSGVMRADPRRALFNAYWADPELRQSERDPARYLAARLGLIRTRGYHGALLWATPLQGTRMRKDPRCAWTQGVRCQLQQPIPPRPAGRFRPERGH